MKHTLAAMLTLLLSFAPFFFPASAGACESDTDCDAGNKCLKPQGQIYGACVGGVRPGNKYDRQPVHNPNLPNYGKTCYQDAECGPRLICEKSNKASGACIVGNR